MDLPAQWRMSLLEEAEVFDFEKVKSCNSEAGSPPMGGAVSRIPSALNIEVRRKRDKSHPGMHLDHNFNQRVLDNGQSWPLITDHVMNYPTQRVAAAAAKKEAYITATAHL